MGVPGLTSFIDENQHLLSDHRLHDARVVIDGNNLFHFLYYYFKVQHQHGGDYDVFADKVRYYFSAFLKCNIEPYIVFDGGYDEDDRKLPTTLKRAKDRIRSATSLSIGKNGHILPILTFDTFVNVLNELKISHVTCDFEADSEVSALANEWNCPVMSNDSDFYIFDVKAGFILFDYVELTVKEQKSETEDSKEYHYLQVQIYHLDNLLSFFKGIDRQCIALFASLMGNDFVDPEMFDPFFAQSSFPRVDSKHFTASKRQERMLNLLMWLESQQSLEDALKKILSHIKQEERNDVERLVQTSLSAYLDLNCSLVDYFGPEESRMNTKSNLRTKGTNSLPYWLVKELRCANAPVTVFNTVVSQRIVLITQIENMSLDSAYKCSLNLRQIFYGILLSLDVELAKSTGHKTKAKQANIEEYSRYLKQLKKDQVTPLYQLKDETDVPYLQKIPHMAEAEREEFLMRCLGGYNIDVKLDDCYKLAVYVIPYWIMNANPRINVLFLYALLICFIKVSILDRGHGLRVENKDGTQTLKERCDSKIRSKARESAERVDNKEHKGLFDTECMHAFSQYQGCLRAAMHLNSLLLQPVTKTQPEKILNGTFYYNVCRELRSRKCPELYAEELLRRGSKLAGFFSDILGAVLRVVPADSLARPQQGKKGSKKRKGGKEGAALPTKKVIESEEEELEEEQEEECFIAACDLNNKFGMLGLE